MGWQVLYLNKLDLSKQHRDSSLSTGASTELNGIRDILRKVREWFLIPFCHRSFWFKEKHNFSSMPFRQGTFLVGFKYNLYANYLILFFLCLLYILNKLHNWIYSTEKNWQGLALISMNEHGYVITLLWLDEPQPESEKRAIFCLWCVEQ